MPSPSKFSLVTSLIVTGGILYGGALLASNVPLQGATPPNTDMQPEMPMLAPIPDVIEDQLLPSKAETSRISVQDAIEERQKIARTKENSSDPLFVTVDGILNTDGKIILIVFDNKSAYDAYDYERAVGYAEIKSYVGKVTQEFQHLTTGPYAVVVFHDENANDEFDMESGYPIEGYGTSGAHSAYDEVSFKEAAIAQGNITVQMHYLQR